MPVWLCSPAESASQFFRCSFSFYRAVTFFDTWNMICFILRLHFFKRNCRCFFRCVDRRLTIFSAELTQNLLDHLQSHSRAELETAQCLTGPHKDDFTVSLSGIDLKAYGSQGQTRTAAISLKLAQRELMAREWGEEPVLLLDDVLSELDPGRQDFVLNKIVSGQVFITCCEPGRFTKLGKTIQIEKGSIRE